MSSLSRSLKILANQLYGNTASIASLSNHINELLLIPAIIAPKDFLSPSGYLDPFVMVGSSNTDATTLVSRLQNLGFAYTVKGRNHRPEAGEFAEDLMDGGIHFGPWTGFMTGRRYFLMFETQEGALKAQLLLPQTD